MSKSNNNSTNSSQSKGPKSNVIPIRYYREYRKGFSPFHMVQNEIFTAKDDKSVSRGEKHEDLLKDFYLGLFSPKGPDKIYPDKYPDNYVYLQLDSSISTQGRKHSQGHAKLIPTELFELVQAYIESQPTSIKPAKKTLQKTQLSEFREFTNKIENSGNPYLKTILNADPEYQNIKIIPAFIKIFSTQLGSLLDYLMSCSLERTADIICEIVSGMYVLLDKIDVDFAGSQYETRGKHLENPYEERKKLDLDQFVRRMYYGHLNLRKSYLPSVDDNGDPSFELYERYSTQYRYLAKAIKYLTNKNVELSEDDRKKSRQEYQMYLLEHHVNQETKQAAKEFQEYYDLITLTSERRRYREVNNIICALRESCKILDPTTWEISSIDIPLTIQSHLGQIDLSLTENANIKVLLHEHPLSSELVCIVEQDLKEYYYPTLGSCINFIMSTICPFKSSSFYNTFRDFYNKIISRASHSEHFNQLIAHLIIQGPYNLIGLSHNNFVPLLFVHRQFQIMHYYLEDIYHQAFIWGSQTRSKHGIGLKDIYTSPDTEPNAESGTDPNTEKKDTKKTLDNKSTDYLEYFRAHIADALTSAILYRIKE